MDTQERIQTAIQALEQSFADFLADTGFSDHPITRLGWYNTAIEIVNEAPDQDPDFQEGIVMYLNSKIVEYRVGLISQWLGSI